MAAQGHDIGGDGAQKCVAEEPVEGVVGVPVLLGVACGPGRVGADDWGVGG